MRKKAEAQQSAKPSGSSGQVGELTYVDIDTFLATLNHQLLLVKSVLSVKIKLPILYPSLTTKRK